MENFKDINVYSSVCFLCEWHLHNNYWSFIHVKLLMQNGIKWHKLYLILFDSVLVTFADTKLLGHNSKYNRLQCIESICSLCHGISLSKHLPVLKTSIFCDCLCPVTLNWGNSRPVLMPIDPVPLAHWYIMSAVEYPSG